MGGYGKTISHVIIGLKTAKGTKQLKVSTCVWTLVLPQNLGTVWPCSSDVTSLCLTFLCVVWVIIRQRAVWRCYVY